MTKPDNAPPAGDGGDNAPPAGGNDDDAARAEREDAVFGRLGDLIEERVDAVLEKRGFSKPKDNGTPAGDKPSILQTIFGA